MCQPDKHVSFHKLSGLWHARIMTHGVKESLGYYRSPEDAHAAYVAAATIKHGKFARSR